MNAAQRMLRGSYIILILAVAFVLTTILGPYVTHPGIHALLALCLLNVVLWKETPPSGLSMAILIAVLLLVDIAGVWVIVYSTFDSVEDWFATMCIVAALLATILHRKGGKVYGTAR